MVARGVMVHFHMDSWVNEFDFPAVDIFVTTTDPILEPCVITMNNVLSLLAVDIRETRDPFRYFTSNSNVLEDDSLEFQHEWKKMKNECADLYKKMELIAQRPFTCERDSEFAFFCDVHRSDHPAIIAMSKNYYNPICC
ncbi:hypothetical protein L1987_78461 [Smallanthus sonchifolius]|uniref:Uncharacterized protein n=1 Tax=Smallanthus sonchifolius TaxID=185202 RepID=A0ACB8ZCR3_9ASTR|nr:hypothetical protein L1987_78461 [Smallanthus sonchifolius]